MYALRTMQCTDHILEVYAKYLSEYVENIKEVFMDNFTVYENSFDVCLQNLIKILQRCIDVDIDLDFENIILW